eukprot:CAMPEP_0197698256 /NCGR_PEP_ID=MMETSP1338-20131121/119061_1 /TAXON_ID=43686 ORGANISM="Pelagodinium beii, Strain RCC1491" /NCGR_SAMPLE_ID=MMETSP1338 /ASSEMBLY_ACC=CAM_ASM_000754 /LENGTH=180 /DNA_ID=CAMNT_0043281607 /DNA_START=160 /DNA_END=699 /DNA_ORIENTATION=-
MPLGAEDARRTASSSSAHEPIWNMQRDFDGSRQAPPLPPPPPPHPEQHGYSGGYSGAEAVPYAYERDQRQLMPLGADQDAGWQRMPLGAAQLQDAAWQMGGGLQHPAFPNQEGQVPESRLTLPSRLWDQRKIAPQNKGAGKGKAGKVCPPQAEEIPPSNDAMVISTPLNEHGQPTSLGSW